MLKKFWSGTSLLVLIFTVLWSGSAMAGDVCQVLCLEQGQVMEVDGDVTNLLEFELTPLEVTSDADTHENSEGEFSAYGRLLFRPVAPDHVTSPLDSTAELKQYFRPVEDSVYFTHLTRHSLVTIPRLI